ncbi:MAG: DUF799 family lipoprotein [Syntrophales bacterium]|nr:DUF799 family lipoprotein [Syntrophales bacterium]
MTRRRLCLFFIMAFLMVTPGCVVDTKDTKIAPQIQSFFKGTYKVYPYMEKHMPRLVAVLPFHDLSRSQQGAQAVRRGFYNHFSSLPFKDMELARVDYLLEKAGLTDPAEINKKSPQELGKILGVDAIVYGEISNFDKLFAVMYSQVAVGAKIKMYDTKSGELLWTGEHTVRIHEGGLSTTPIGIVATIVATAMNVRDIQLLRACDDLFRDMVKTIPTPTLAEALKPPVIQLLVQDTKNEPKKAGDLIRVVIQGTPKMRAFFDIGDYKKHIDMEEQADTPGVYVGTYKVVPGDNVRRAIITGYLKDDTGNTAQWVDAVGYVTLKTTPPDRPAVVRTVGRNGLVILNWDKSKDPDLAGYRVYRSRTPLSGYVEIAKTEVTEYRDTGLANGEKYYYRVTAYDQAGNESDASEAIGIPIAPGPTKVAGTIESDTTWYSGASPYVLEGVVVIKDKARLTIEPGTEIVSSDGGLVVEGSLLAAGDREHIISWDAIREDGTWQGITFHNVREKENILSYNRIRRAQTALTVRASSPRIEHCEIALNKTGVVVVGAFSQPQITNCSIHRNGLYGIDISDHARPKITENIIEANGATGIRIVSGSPEVKGNRIVGNKETGITLETGVPLVQGNNIMDNKPFNAIGPSGKEVLDARENWWGSAKGIEILATLKGRINIETVLDAPSPTGKAKKLPILSSELGGTLSSDGYLIAAHSPYRVTKDLTITNGANLYIEPGVVLKYDQNTSIIVEDGGVTARGTSDRPIRFTANASSPTPGFYHSAFRFTQSTKESSSFAYCIFEYADIALDIHRGAPEISKSMIVNNGQAGIYCRNDAAPTIVHSIFQKNRGEGAIVSVGNSRPKINYNQFQDNDFALQARSTIYIDARENWWGKNPPDLGMIFGDLEKNVNIKPWLDTPPADLFGGNK